MANSIALNKSSKKKKTPFSRILFIISFLVLPVLNFLIFYVYVNFSSIIMAFRQRVGDKTIWTFENFRMFFNEFGKESSLLREALRNTTKSFIILEIMFFVGFFVSYFLYKKILGHKLFRTIFFLPGLLAGTIVSSYIIKMCSLDGPIAPFIQKILKLDDLPMLLDDSRYANTTIFVVMIWLGIPSNMVLWGGAFSRIPEEVLESAKLDGVNWVQEAFKIIIPIIWPSFCIQLILSFVGFFGASGSVFLLTQGELGTMTISCWLYLQLYNNVGNLDASNVYNYMSAIGIIMTLITMVIVVITRTITNKFFKEVSY